MLYKLMKMKLNSILIEKQLEVENFLFQPKSKTEIIFLHI